MSTDPQTPWADYSRKLGRNLQTARIDAGLTQEQVAHDARISTFTYQKLENGESNPGTPANPRLQTLVSLAVVLRVDITHLLPPPSFALVGMITSRTHGHSRQGD
ncbi:transcriptional regulator with XRE-family HTH domain [Microbacterium sp. SORGH_AS 1204]|uniref:helix-turn-helix domain-containing protein n=1 Tax=Microbacterium sp. SORGH_AS_1204 TaxID=3041785 RepID=UPI002793516A|nr:helix-turn-helix transcriptional regulator [Microbacterium sp. SORGH_AS_1204]MDQ1135763.1 transcriptional regulator with XRE-family HTH domain [Microbacterium sp. SORGH_AS_1204]